MNELNDMLKREPCYEQHIVSIKDVYEKYLMSILVPALYEGFRSIYKKAIDLEVKFQEGMKKNPNIENPGVLSIFQTLISDIPNLNNHKIKNETDRIRSSSKSANIFDDLIKAVVKSNIILLTYNVDGKRKDLINSRFHENIIIYDFIHSCYIQCGKNFFGRPELFWHKYESIEINKNKRDCYNIIAESIEEAVRLMLPMKEILLEYLTQKYEQKEHVHMGYMNHMGHMNIGDPDYLEVDQMIERDLPERYNAAMGDGLLEDDYDNQFEEGEPKETLNSLLENRPNEDEPDDVNKNDINKDDINKDDADKDKQENEKSMKMVDVAPLMNDKKSNLFFKNMVQKEIKEGDEQASIKIDDIQITRSNASEAPVEEKPKIIDLSEAHQKDIKTNKMVDDILK